MTFELKTFEKAQLSQTADLWHAGWHDAHARIVPEALVRLRTRDDFARRLDELGAKTRIACDPKGVLGFASVIEDELYQMYVAKSAQGTGVAQALMGDALRRITKNGARTAWLACSIGNLRAAAFYEKTGWVNRGEESVALDTSAGAFDLVVWKFEKQLEIAAAGPAA